MTEHIVAPGQDGHEAVPGSPAAEGDPTGGHNRRKFLAGAGAVALAATVAGAATGLPAAAEEVDAIEADGPGTSPDAVVAYVSNPARGEITLFRGGQEVVVHDDKLARALTSRIDQALARTPNQER
jgi:fructose-1,6-bisphosphatase/inositol monophosphatase family enzyme